MAKQRSLISGKVGPVVTYELYGKTICRSRPSPYKQTRATKARSSNFGIASRAGKILRNLIDPVLPFPKDRQMQGRFSGALSKWMAITPLTKLLPESAIPHVKDFQFSERSELGSRWKVSLLVTKLAANKLKLSIPAFVPVKVIAAPAHTVSVECNIAAAACRLADGKPGGSFSTRFIIPYNEIEIPVQDIFMSVPAKPGHIVITAISLVYTINKKGDEGRNTNPAFMPAAVVSAMYC
jgi:hypothetical protein